jgi:hypothetical protein
MTVYSLPRPCWTVVPEPPRGCNGSDPHHGTRAEALAAIREAWDEDREHVRGLVSAALEKAWWREFRFRLSRLRPGAPRPRQTPARCWLIRCDGCEEHIDEQDEGYIAHCDSRRDAEETMAACEWAYRGDLVFCPEDAPEGSEIPPPSPAEQEAAGQLSLLAQPGVAS